MSDKLEELTRERRELLDRASELLIDINKIKQNNSAKKHREETKQIKEENKKLREMVAILSFENGNTYARIGEKLGVSSSRASQIVARGIRRLQTIEKIGYQYER